MSNAKYIVFGFVGADRDVSHAVIFSDRINHSSMSAEVTGANPGLKPVSAGFVSVGKGRHDTISASGFGDSFSLGIRAHEDDSRILSRMLGLNP